MSRKLATLPGVVSLLSRNSYANRTFTPALSDIDIAVVIEDELAPAQINALLRKLDTRFTTLRSRYPLFGEFPVYTRKGFGIACRLGIMTLQTYAWRCEWGDDSVLLDLQNPAGHSPLERLSRGTQIYTNGFHANLQAAMAMGRSRSSLAMERSVKKMEREIGAGISPPRGSLEAVLAGALTHVDRALSAQVWSSSEHCWPVVDKKTGKTQIVRREELPDKSSLRAIISQFRGNHAWYVLASDSLANSSGEALSLAQADLVNYRPFTILTPPMMEFYLRQLRPLAYYQLQLSRTVAGEDMMHGLAAPSAHGFLGFFCSEIAHLLTLNCNLERRAQVEPRLLYVHTLRLQRVRHFLEHQQISLHPHVPNDNPSSVESVEGVIQNIHQLIDMMQHNTDALLGDDQVVMT